MYHRLPLSPTRILCWLAISVVIAVACVAVIHLVGANLRPLVELFYFAAIGGVLALLIPHLPSAVHAGWRALLGPRSWKRHLRAADRTWRSERRGQKIGRETPIFSELDLVLSVALKRVRELLLAPRRLQFSVQAGLVYLSVFCVWLGVNVDRGHRCEVAARAIERAGGRVSSDSPRMLGQVRSVSIARRDAPSDDVTLLGLIPHIHALQPRRIVIGSRASSTVITTIQAEFPTTNIVLRGSNTPATQSVSPVQ